MAQQENVYVIDTKVVYDEIRDTRKDLGNKLDVVSHQLVNHEARLTSLEQKDKRSWQMIGVWITAIAAILAAVVAPLMGG